MTSTDQKSSLILIVNIHQILETAVYHISKQLEIRENILLRVSLLAAGFFSKGHLGECLWQWPSREEAKTRKNRGAPMHLFSFSLKQIFERKTDWQHSTSRHIFNFELRIGDVVKTWLLVLDILHAKCTLLKK